MILPKEAILVEYSDANVLIIALTLNKAYNSKHMLARERPQWRKDLDRSTLHPDIQNVLHIELLHLKSPFMILSHLRPPATIIDKLNLLASQPDVISSYFNQFPLDKANSTIRRFIPRVARTLTCHTEDGSLIGLVTSFLDKDEPVTPNQMRKILESTEYPTYPYKKLRWNRPDEGLMKFIGAKPGTIGPWATTDTSFPLYVIDEDTHMYNTGEHAVVDLALAPDMSLLILGQSDAIRFIQSVNEALGRDRPIIVDTTD